MKNLGRRLTFIRRAALAVCTALLFLSSFGALIVDKGGLGSRDFTTVFSANGYLAYVNVHPTRLPREPATWSLDFSLYSEQRQRSGSFYGDFNWPTLGFRYLMEDRPSSSYSPASSIRTIVIPYWPFVLVLLFPDLVLWIRRFR